LGIALLPSSFAGSALERGELVAVLPEVLGANSTLMVLHLDRELVPAAVRAFVDAVVDWAKEDPFLAEHQACERALEATAKQRTRVRTRAKAK
jgi:DNA-binding transcriptional LysR family regulator